MTAINGGEVVPEGSVHGRFQPFHNEHLAYAMAAKERCKFLWIGLTRYDVTADQMNPLGRHREKAEANPLSFYERTIMIREALVEGGVDISSFGFVPFPIETPSHLQAFLPTSVTCYTTICEDWNREKIAVLRQHGYSVVVLWEREKKVVTATNIRSLLVEGSDEWKALVPPAVARRIVDWGVGARLREIAAS